MAKKFIIKDEEGKQFEITETSDEVPETLTEREVKDDEILSADEIAVLKLLAARSSELLGLLEVKSKDEEPEVKDDEEPIVEDDDLEEKVIETKDSRRSVGSIEKHSTKTKDSLDNREIAIADAWSKRFAKSYKGE